MEVLGFPVVQGWGPGVILAGVIVLIVMGRLVPKAQHDREIKFRDDLITQERESTAYWRQAALGAQSNAEGALGAARFITQTEGTATRLVETMQQRFTPQDGEQT